MPDEQKENKKTSIIQTKATHILSVAILSIICFVTIMGIFGLGIWVGEKRAEFSFQWAANYHRNFGGPRNGVLGNFPDSDFTNSHGVFGSVMEINGSTLTIKGQDDVEKTVVAAPTTTIVSLMGEITVSDIKAGDMVVVIGEPDDQGQINAKFIRILPDSSSFLIYPNINS